MNVNHYAPRRRRGSNDHSLMLDNSSHRTGSVGEISFSPFGVVDPADDEVARTLCMLDAQVKSNKKRPSPPKRQASNNKLFNFFKRHDKNKGRIPSDKLSLPPSPTRKASQAISLDLSRDATQVFGFIRREQKAKQHASDEQLDHLVGSFLILPHEDKTRSSRGGRRETTKSRLQQQRRPNLGKSKSARSLPKPSFLPELKRALSYHSSSLKRPAKIIEEDDEDEEPSTSTSPTIPTSTESSPSVQEQQPTYVDTSDSFHTANEESPLQVIPTTTSSSCDPTSFQDLKTPPPTPPQAMTTVIEIAPGLSVPLRSSKETLEYVKRGEIVSTLCSCGTMMHTLNDAEFVLCPTCRVVERLSCSGVGVGLGFVEDWEEWQVMMLNQEAQEQRQVEL